MAGQKGGDKGGQRVQILDDNYDLTAQRDEFPFHLPKSWEKFICTTLKDQRDLPIALLIANVSLTLLPGALFVILSNTPTGVAWLPTWFRHVCGVVYVTSMMAIYLERFLLMLHFMSHRLVFTQEWDFIHRFTWFIITPLFGMPGGVYRLHHVIMHHSENNHAPLDTSSTERYQRDSFADFSIYWLRFWVLASLETPIYALITKRYSWFFYAVWHISLWIGTVVVGYLYVSPTGFAYVFLIPYFLALSAMSFGNWSQHIFVDPDCPHVNARLTYNCYATPTNQRTYNDGYHLLHHQNPRLHWSELPKVFMEQKHAMAAEGGLVFKGVHFFDVGVFVMGGNLRKLVENHYMHVPPPGVKPSEVVAPLVDDIVVMLQGRLKPVPKGIVLPQAEAGAVEDLPAVK